MSSRMTLHWRYAKTILSKWSYDRIPIQAEEDQKFIDFELDQEGGLKRLNGILIPIRGEPFDYLIDSIHWLLFAALSLKTQPEHILEIGTYDGIFTKVLGELFPQSKIITIDLPDDDPILRDTYNREEDEAYSKFAAMQADNVSGDNIDFRKINSFFLPTALNQKFDLIWADGDHLNPGVAWDLCNAFHMCKLGGYILCDDVILHQRGFKDKYVSRESRHILDYMVARTDEPLSYFLKRRFWKWSAYPNSRKYVSILKHTNAEFGNS